MDHWLVAEREELHCKDFELQAGSTISALKTDNSHTGVHNLKNWTEFLNDLCRWMWIDKEASYQATNL
jgi:hypothetical protein